MTRKGLSRTLGGIYVAGSCGASRRGRFVWISTQSCWRRASFSSTRLRPGRGSCFGRPTGFPRSSFGFRLFLSLRKPFLIQNLEIQAEMLFRHDRLRVVLLDIPATGFTDPLTQASVFQQGNDAARKRLEISLVDDISRDFVLDHLGHSSHIGHNDRASRRESFQHRQTDWFGY